MAGRPLETTLLTTLAAQTAAVGDWMAALTDEECALPSVLTGWRVAELATHVAHILTALADPLEAPRPPVKTRQLSIAAYTARYAAGAAEIAAREVQAAKGRTAADISAHYGAEAARLTADLEALAGRDVVVAARRGPLKVSDMLRIRITELVVHADDLARSVRTRSGPVRVDSALRVAVRMLTGVLAERYPGRSIEVRVPPFAAVQCGPESGPTHTRGTPPTVVECTPWALVQVATGRRPFADAVATADIIASGSRADLAVFLPLLR